MIHLLLVSKGEKKIGQRLYIECVPFHVYSTHESLKGVWFVCNNGRGSKNVYYYCNGRKVLGANTREGRRKVHIGDRTVVCRL